MAAATDVAMWDACGGRSTYGQNASDPSVACPAGSYCNFYNEWFWQCQPDASDVSEAATQTVTYPVACAVSTVTLGMSMHRCMCCCGLSRSERWMDVPGSFRCPLPVRIDMPGCRVVGRSIVP